MPNPWPYQADYYDAAGDRIGWLAAASLDSAFERASDRDFTIERAARIVVHGPRGFKRSFVRDDSGEWVVS